MNPPSIFWIIASWRKVSACLLSAITCLAGVSTIRADVFDPGDNTIDGAVRIPPPSQTITTVEPTRDIGFISSDGTLDFADFFIIRLTSGTNYVFTSLSDGDPVINIINVETGELIATGGITTFDFFITVNPPLTGDYYIAITPFSESTVAFAYDLSYYIEPEDGGLPPGDGGITTGTGGITAPVDFVSFSGVPTSIIPSLDNPSIAIESQNIRETPNETFLRVSGIAKAGVDAEADEIDAIRSEIPLVSVEFRYRYGNGPWTDWMNTQGVEEWRFRVPMSDSTFIMFEVRVTDVNGKTSRVLGVES